ncbi:MAG: outer membrane beta-barrel protein [Gemmataceae bacterium]|nr:outer membrane beta-barrel protein [Gemmataceae bacterium]
MLKTLMFSAALMLGQTDAPSAPQARLLAPVDGRVVIGQPAVHHGPVTVTAVSMPHGNLIVQPIHGALVGACGDSCGVSCCPTSCGHDRCCNVTWLKPWTCDDLKMEPVECKPRCCGGFLHGLLFCPPEEENGNGNCNGNGNGEKKNGAEEKKDGNGNGEEAEEEDDLTPLMQAIKCRFPVLFDRMECTGTKIYGWVQFGYTVNLDSPNDRLNLGPNFNNRSNDFSWNDIPYIVIERPLDLDKKKDQFHVGYRLDTTFGHNAPHWANFGLGLFENFTGSRLQTPRTHELGLDMPQMYVEAHLPVLTDRGVDIRLGRFFELCGYELSPATQTPFYSHSYEYPYAVPFTIFGAMATVHIGDTVDFQNAFVRGWEVSFHDINDAWGYTGALVWNSCDKRTNVILSWITSPEQIQNNDNWRQVISVNATRKAGCYNEWQFTVGSHVGWEEDVVQADRVGAAEWYGVSGYVLYTVNPKLILGTRGEWFRDDDGVRVTFFNDQALDATRPGSAGNYFEWTLGFTYKPYQNLRLRPEVRFDWFDGPAGAGAPFNDRTDRFMTTLGIDAIWEF